MPPEKPPTWMILGISSPPETGLGNAWNPRVPSMQAPVSIHLTPAERRVLHVMLEGASNGAIAIRLCLSRRTVEGHVSALLQKTGCRSRTQLVLWALGRVKFKN